MKAYIRTVSYLHENTPTKRQLKIKLSNGTKIYAESCHESWQQWGGTTEDLYITMPVVENHLEWLQGGERPCPTN